MIPRIMIITQTMIAHQMKVSYYTKDTAMTSI